MIVAGKCEVANGLHQLPWNEGSQKISIRSVQAIGFAVSHELKDKTGFGANSMMMPEFGWWTSIMKYACVWYVSQRRIQCTNYWP